MTYRTRAEAPAVRRTGHSVGPAASGAPTVRARTSVSIERGTRPCPPTLGEEVHA